MILFRVPVERANKTRFFNMSRRFSLFRQSVHIMRFLRVNAKRNEHGFHNSFSRICRLPYKMCQIGLVIYNVALSRCKIGIRITSGLHMLGCHIDMVEVLQLVYFQFNTLQIFLFPSTSQSNTITDNRSLNSTEIPTAFLKSLFREQEAVDLIVVLAQPRKRTRVKSRFITL